VSNDFHIALTEASRDVLYARRQFEEHVLRCAVIAGAKAVTVEWPNDFGTSTRWEFSKGRQLRRLTRQADRLRRATELLGGKL
jgi:hypothetical protein